MGPRAPPSWREQLYSTPQADSCRPRWRSRGPPRFLAWRPAAAASPFSLQLAPRSKPWNSSAKEPPLPASLLGRAPLARKAISWPDARNDSPPPWASGPHQEPVSRPPHGYQQESALLPHRQIPASTDPVDQPIP